MWSFLLSLARAKEGFIVDNVYIEGVFSNLVKRIFCIYSSFSIVTY